MLLLKMLLKTSYHQLIIPEVQITQRPKFTCNRVTIYSTIKEHQLVISQFI